MTVTEEIDYLKANRDEYIRYQAAHRLMTTLGFFLCLLSGFGIGLAVGHRSHLCPLTEPHTKPEGLWESATPLPSDDPSPRIR